MNAADAAGRASPATGANAAAHPGAHRAANLAADRAPNAANAVTTAAGLALLLAWDATGLDLRVTRWFGDAHGFALRHNWWTSTLLHDGGRQLAWLVLAALAVCAWRAPGHLGHLAQSAPSALRPQTPSRRRRWFWLGVMVLCALAVPAIKRFSATSCPWQLAEFGGVARHVSHWQFGVADGGSGRCFPSGHAVAAFAFFGMFFLWRPFNPARARLWLAGVFLAGAAFGIAQLVRGAHHPSHTLWSAWLCWAVGASADRAAAWAARRRSGRAQIAGAAQDRPRAVHFLSGMRANLFGSNKASARSPSASKPKTR